MLKKIFCAAFLCAAIIFVSDAKVFAQDVWIHTDSRGVNYYVMNETIVDKTQRRGTFIAEVKVKAVNGRSLLSIKKYHVEGYEAAMSYSIDGSEKKINTTNEDSTLAIKVLWYCFHYLGYKSGPFFGMGP